MKNPTLVDVFKAIPYGLFASLLCVCSTAVAQVTETESNNTAAEAQHLLIPAEGLTVSARIGGSTESVTTDDDFFSFDAVAGDVPTIRVISDGTGWDGYLMLYDSSGTVVNQNDDAYPQNPDSVSPWDPGISGAALEATDTYYIVVTSLPRFPSENFSTSPSYVMGMAGNYELRISGVTATADTGTPPGTGNEIAIEVRRWNGQDAEASKRWERNAHSKSKGRYPVPVIMFSSDSFDARSVDKQTLRFGPFGDEDSMFHCSNKMRDVNKDGMDDMMCFFDGVKAGFEDGDVQGYLTGKTKDGVEFSSNTTLRVYRRVKEKSEPWYERRGRDPQGSGHNARGRRK